MKSFKEFHDLNERHYRIGKNGDRYKGKRGAGVCFTDGSKILLLKRSKGCDHPGTWCIPGGRGKPGESDIDAAKREAKEECGSNSGQRFDSMSVKDGSFTWTTYFYKINAPFDCDLSDEHTDSKWVDIDEVESLDLHPKFKHSWPSYKKRLP